MSCSQAAEAGDPDATAHLGHMYANGNGVDQDNGTALAYFSAAAEVNHPGGLYGLGYMYLSGYGVEKDHKKAFAFFQKAAEQVLRMICKAFTVLSRQYS